MKISVLLPSLFPDLAHQAMDALRPQLRDVDHEFVVVSPAPFSGENVRWVEETERRGAVAAMQTASEHAQGDVMLITSDDFRLSKGAVAEALAAFSDPARPFPLALTYPHRMRAIDCVFANFGCLSPSVCVVGKADAQHVGGAHDPAYRQAYGDTDLGMRIMAAGGTVRRARAHAREVEDRQGSGAAARNSTKIEADWGLFHSRWAPRFDPIWGNDPVACSFQIAADALPILSPERPDTLAIDGRLAARDLRIVRAMTLVAYHNRANLTAATIEAGLRYFQWVAKLSPHPLQVNVSGWYWAGVTRAPGDPQGQSLYGADPWAAPDGRQP